MFGFAVLKSSTIFLVAACDPGRNASDWNLRVTGPESEAEPDPEGVPPPPQAARVSSSVAKPPAAIRRISMFLPLRSRDEGVEKRETNGQLIPSPPPTTGRRSAAV